jgi:hypothetical protein
VVQQVAQGEQAGAGALQDGDAGRAEQGGGGRVDGGRQAGQHGDGLGRGRGGGEHGPRVGIVLVELWYQVDGQGDGADSRVGGQRGQALREQGLGVAATPPHVQRVGRSQAGVEHRGQPLPGVRLQDTERDAQIGGELSDVRAFQARVVHGGNAGRRGGGLVSAGAGAAGAGLARPGAAGREELEGVG